MGDAKAGPLRLSFTFRQSIYSRPAGYDDTNDAARLAEDPAFQMLASQERPDTSVALTSTLHLVRDGCPHEGTELPRTDSSQHGTDPARVGPIDEPTVILDIDSSASPVHGA